LSLFVEENTERVQREKDAQIMVVIGNPPYNVGQKSENDNNKNRKYPIIDQHIRETYVKDSKATLKTQLYDAYARFFRWATDRLQGRDGIVCMVTNNSFVDQFAFDGMRRHLFKDFNLIYHLDLHGNVRKNPKLSGTTHNVFGIQIGVGITVAVRNSQHSQRLLRYYRVPEDWRKMEKLAFLAKRGDITNIDWLDLQPDERYTWITEDIYPEFATFLPMGIKRVDASLTDMPTLFKMYSGGVKTNRDTWVYDFNFSMLREKMEKFVETYNSEVDRWKRRGSSKITTDDFVNYDDRKIKWSEHLKYQLMNEKYIAYSDLNIRSSIYRPFTKLFLYFDPTANDRRLLQYLFFPSPTNEKENRVICLSGISSNKPFHCLAVNYLPDFHLTADTQCFPYYTYAEDGTNRRENITDWALKQFQDRYGSDVSKWDMFHYVYGLLHHPQYRERYKENLKRDLPHIPLLRQREKFLTCVQIGKQLMDLHLNYEQVKEYHLERLPSKEAVPFSWHVEKMRLSTDKRVVVVNESQRLGPLPPECFEYRLGNRSALEWVIDQYQVTQDKRSGIESDPNRLEDEEYIVRLVGRVVTVSVETVKLVNELARAVTVEDWLEDTEIAKPL
jgi:predicted helicase